MYGHQFEDNCPALWGLHWVSRISYSWASSWDSVQTLIVFCHSTIQFTCLYLHAGTTGEAPSKLSTFPEQEQQMKELEDLTIQLQSMTYEHIELGELLDNCHYKDLNNR